jgi:PAS domain S-box-containing protein
MVRHALERYEVIEAADAATARQLMKTAHPQIVLLDLVLPDADGLELLDELRGIGGSAVTYVAFSSFGSKLDEERLSAVGFDDIIAKPVAPAQLAQLVEAYVPVVSTQFGTGKRIVVADDSELQLKLTAFRLGRLGFAVETVPNGARALTAIRRSPPDVVVSDVMMPELDGFGLALAMRQDPQLRDLPLVLMTSSYVEAKDRELARRAGATELVIRTPDLVELIDLLRKTMATPRPGGSVSHESHDDLERERVERITRQLERQVVLNTGLVRRCSSLASELAVLAGLGDTVLQRRDIAESLDEALVACFDATDVVGGAIYLVDDGARSLGDTGWSQHDVETFFGERAKLDAAIRTGELLLIDSGPILERSGAAALLVAPLRNARGPLGALVMARSRAFDTQDWRAFAVGVASQIGQVLTLARAYADAEAAEKRAAEQAALLSAIVASAPDFVIRLDRNAIIEFMNRAPLGRTLDDFIGTDWLSFVASDERTRARAAFDQALAGDKSKFEVRTQSTTYEVRWYQGRLAPIRNGDRITGVVLISRDVTEKKQTEVQLMLADRMASVGSLAAGVAHEINNPLAAVIANLDMALEEVNLMDAPTDLVEELQDARSSADRVREIVRDLKLFSRTQEDLYGAVNVEKVIDSTLRMAWNEVRHRAKLVKHYGTVPRVLANESRLGQVLLNIIVNAAQAIPEGKYESNVLSVRTTAAKDTVRISISDTGTGIPLDVQQRLFTPFFTTKPVGVGTGLGLAISHRIITGMSGTLTFESEVGKGSTFHITLPIAGEHVLPITTKLPMLAVSTRRGRVLVIDDEESLAHAMRRYLSQDHDVEAVTTARAALDLVAQGMRFDVILCDLMMPQITGIEVHDTIRALDPKQAEKIVFVTGGPFTETARAFFEKTPNHRIEKPFDLKQLRMLVNDLMSASA